MGEKPKVAEEEKTEECPLEAVAKKNAANKERVRKERLKDNENTKKQYRLLKKT